MKHLTSLFCLLFAALACGSEGPERGQLVQVTVSHGPDGQAHTRATVVDRETGDELDSYVVEDEPDADDVEEKAFSWSPRFGEYSAGTSADSRCPTGTWSSPKFCVVPPVKVYSMKIDQNPGLISGGAINVNGVTSQALTYLDFKGGFEIDPTSGPYNALLTVDTAGVRSCRPGDPEALACTTYSYDITKAFNNGGRRFVKTIVAANAKPNSTYNDTLFHTRMLDSVLEGIISGHTAAEKQAFFRHVVIHEIWTHGYHGGHNPSGQITNQFAQYPEFFQVPGSELLQTEINAASAYTPQ